FIEVFPISDGVFDLTITFPAQPEGSAMNYEVWGSPGVDTGSYEWDNEDFFDLDLNCVAAPVDTAPPLPADYVLKSILCDTAVYDTPAGTPVGDGRVSAGQTFFVSPTSETGADGNEWV